MIMDLALMLGRNAMAIWQDLVSDHGFGGSYEAVKRFVRKLRGVRSDTCIQTGPGEDYAEHRVMVSNAAEPVQSFDWRSDLARPVST